MALRPWQKRQREHAIRDIACAQLSAPEDDFDTFGYIHELKQLKKDTRRSIPHLEAMIMLNMGAQIKAMRTRQAMAKLRDLRKKAGTEDEFFAFEGFLKKITGTEILMGHTYAPDTFKTMDQDAVWENVRAVVEKVQRLAGELFLNSGTLLGVVRDKALIAHDDDIDLAVRLNANSAEEAAAEWRRLRDVFVEADMLDIEAINNPAIFKLKSDTSYNIDLFPMWFEGERAFVYPHTFGELRKDDVFPLKPCAVTGLPIPAEPEKMLEINYGPNWPAPDPYFEFPWGRTRRNFKAFTDAV